MKLLRWYITFVDGLTVADIAICLLYAWALLIVAAMVGWLISFWRYTPDSELRIPADPRPKPPRAPGSKARRVS